LFLVDVISSLGCFDFRMDDWQVDVVVGGSQKGLMLPVGMSFTGISAKALKASETARLPRIYWDWRRYMTGLKQTSFPGTAPVHLYYGLQEALHMILEEGLDQKRPDARCAPGGRTTAPRSSPRTRASSPTR
jgi:alanine-glyoxylate transaminase/serine-glyoxylate transaminase/serine-pyruvate transaminase